MVFVAGCLLFILQIVFKNFLNFFPLLFLQISVEHIPCTKHWVYHHAPKDIIVWRGIKSLSRHLKCNVMGVVQRPQEEAIHLTLGGQGRLVSQKEGHLRQSWRISQASHQQGSK